MPTYEYECEACGHHFDEMQSFKDEPLKVCPACGKETLRRLFGTGAAILFKGSGFYETDYRSESYKKAAKAEKESGSGTDGKSTPAKESGSTGGGSTESKASEPKSSPPGK